MDSDFQLLKAVARVSEALKTTLSLDQISRVVLEACIAQGEVAGARVVLNNGESGERLISQGLGVQLDLRRHEDQALSAHQSVIIQGLHVEVSGAGQEGAPLAGLIVPILYQSEVAGLLTLLFSNPASITEGMVTFAGTLANLLATALGNLGRYEELSARNQALHRYAQQVERVSEAGRVLHEGSELPAVYEDLVYAIQDSVEYRIVILSLVEETDGNLLAQVAAGAGLPLNQLRLLQANPFPWSKLELLFTPSFELGNAYFIPAGATAIQHDIVRLMGAQLYLGRNEQMDGEWRADDLLVIPFRDSSGKPLGMISLAAPLDERRPDLGTARILEIFANQVAASIENIRLYHDTRTFARQLSHLQEVSQGVLSEHDPVQRLQLLVNGLQAAGWQRVLLFQFDPGSTNNQLIAAGYTEAEYDSLLSVQHYTHSWGATGAYSGPQSDPASPAYFVPAGSPSDRPPGEKAPLSEPDAWQSGDLLRLPIMDRNGRVVALIQLDKPADGKRPTRRALRHIELFARFTAAVLENMKLVNELQRLNHELDARVDERTRQLAEESDRVKTLLRISVELTASLDKDRVLSRALTLINETIGATQGHILLVDPESGTLKMRASLTHSTLSFSYGWASEQFDEMLRRVVAIGKPAIVNDLQSEQTGNALCSVLAVPLSVGEEVSGVLTLIHERPKYFVQRHLELAIAAAIQVAQALHNADLYDLIREQAESLGKMMRDAHDEVAKTHSILESIGDGVLVAQADGMIILINEAACAMLRVRRDELLFVPVSSLRRRIGPAGDAWLDALQRLYSAKERSGQEHTQTERILVGNRALNVTLSAVEVGQRFVGSVSVLHDMTREAEVDRLKSEFVSTVSHELRTPMTSVKGYADLLLMGIAGQLNPTQESYLQVIKSNANRLGYLVDDLLDISRIETGKAELQLQGVKLADLVAGMLIEQIPMKLRSRNKQLDVHAEIPGDLPLVFADPEKVVQILANLLDNAISYTPAGGEICISCGRDGDTVWTSVRDSGIGISDEQLPRIFDRFYRADHEVVLGVAGTGLGLSIVKSLVELHGGEIRVESRPGEGSSFKFSLPIAAG